MAAGQVVFGRYTLKRILGRGGMGVVWLVDDGKLGREIALKFLPEVVVHDPRAVEDLKREARRNLDLTHAHIVRIYDFVEGATGAALAMEYVDGTTLARRSLEQPGHVFPVEVLAPWIEQLCHALAYAHEEVQIVHRDLKPANLMVDRRGRLKVTDFGIARSVADSVSRVSAQIGSSGTPVYMSPQQMMGEKPAIADDVYSLGATLYELLTGRPPFYSGNIFAQVQTKVPPSIMERRHELGVAGGTPVPAAWEAGIAACLAKDAAARPATTMDLLARLRQDGPVGGPVLATPTRSTGDSRRSAATGQRAYGVLSAAAAAVLLAGAAGWYFWNYVPEQRRLEEIRRLQEQGRAEDARRLQNEQELSAAAAREQNEREQREFAVIIARIDTVTDGAPASLRMQVGQAVEDYLRSAPAKYQSEVQARWMTRSAAWETARLAAARGGIVIRTRPEGAEVRVGAVALERSPVTLKELRLGRYPVQVRHDGYEDWQGDVEVKENAFADLDVTLVRSTGQLTVTSGTDTAEVEIRPATGEGTPFRARGGVAQPFPTGDYIVVLRRSGWAERTHSVRVVRGAVTAVAVHYADAGRGVDWLRAASTADLAQAAGDGWGEAMIHLGDRHVTGDRAAIDYRAALEWYERARGAATHAAQHRLVLLAARSAIQERSYETLDGWLREAVEAGEAHAVVTWAVRLRNGWELDPVAPDKLAAALRELEERANSGDLMAMGALSFYYLTGATPIDPAAGLRWAQRAWEAGSMPAALHLAYAAREGRGMAKDEAAALRWLEPAAKAGDAMAMRTLGLAYFNGHGVAKDERLGVEWFRKAEQLRNPDAWVSLGIASQRGAGGVPASFSDAFAWWKKAAEVGNPSGMHNVGWIYMNGHGVPADPNEALRWYRKAAARGSAASLGGLGEAYSRGLGVPANDAEALRYWRAGAAEEQPYCLHSLGWAYANGRGVPASLDEAINYWKRAARLGFSASEDELRNRGISW